MQKTIINRVANSPIEVIDLKEYLPKEPVIQIDMAQWLDAGLILREKEFRAALKQHPWQQYKGKMVAVFCSTDAILPTWAYMLVASHLFGISLRTEQGLAQNLLYTACLENLAKTDFSFLKDKPVIIKGCGEKELPQGIFLAAQNLIQPFAKSIMYGEACSAVPIFKK